MSERESLPFGRGDRKSEASIPPLLTDDQEIAKREAENGVRQYDRSIEVVLSYIDNPERIFRLRPSLILELQRCALDGIDSYAGNWRPGPVSISESNHQPVPAHLVPFNIEEMCDYVNDNWDSKTPIYLSAYVLWKLNWIHPFTDGNGRTSRIISYVVLCIKLKMKLPGTKAIPEQIAFNKNPYYCALEKADEVWKKECRIDVSDLEKIIEDALASQLLSIIEDATGSKKI